MHKNIKDLIYSLGYEIRKASFKDLEGIIFVYLVAWKESYTGILSQTFLDNLKLENPLELQYRLFKKIQGIHYVALYNDQVVGFCDAGVLSFHKNQNISDEQKRKRTERGEIYALYLLRGHQNKGIGKALFQRVREQLKEKKLVPFLLWALKENKRAHGFYESQGGVLVDEINVRIGDYDYPEVAYRFED
jgi:GNAT superfamily N-acetyltransferase